jgi:hypothetical protein
MAYLPTLRPRWGRRSATLGALLWSLLLLPPIGDSPETALMQRVVLLGVLVIVPLGLSLVPATQSKDQNAWMYQLTLLAQPFGAIAALVSFLIEPAVPAAILASLWFCVTAVIALLGLWRFGQPEFRSAAEVSINAGLIYLPVGSGWLIVSRLGFQLLGYGETIILLTVVHFHFAAYAAPILAGLAGRKLRYGRVDRVFKLAPIGIIAGIPLVAAGISFSPYLAFVGTILLSLGLFLLAILVAGWIVPSVGVLPAQILLLISSASSLPAMTFACLYAYSIVFKKLLIDIPKMAMTHGIVNAFGFALCGLIAWSIINRANTHQP